MIPSQRPIKPGADVGTGVLIIPHALIEVLKLQGNTLAIFAIICQTLGSPTPQSMVASEAGVCRRTVERATSRLVRAGYLRKVSSGTNPCVWRLGPAIGEDMKETIRRRAQGAPATYERNEER